MRKFFYTFLLLIAIASAEQIDSIKVKVGSENAYKPFAYLDEKNVATGYDNDVLRLLASIDGKIELEFISIPWNAIFVGLDSGKFDLVANQISKTPTREEKYIFSAYPYFYGKSVLIVKDGSSINKPEDLKGKVVGTSVGSNHSSNIENYAKAHPELGIKIKYYKGFNTIVQDLQNGRIDAMINDPLVALNLAKEQNIIVKVTDVIFSQTPSFLIFKKSDEKLAKRLDKALEKAIQSGALSELSIKYFGIDLSK